MILGNLNERGVQAWNEIPVMFFDTKAPEPYWKPIVIPNDLVPFSQAPKCDGPYHFVPEWTTSSNAIIGPAGRCEPDNPSKQGSDERGPQMPRMREPLRDEANFLGTLLSEAGP